MTPAAGPQVPDVADAVRPLEIQLRGLARLAVNQPPLTADLIRAAEQPLRADADPARVEVAARELVGRQS